jgi:hypothetical protein
MGTITGTAVGKVAGTEMGTITGTAVGKARAGRAMAIDMAAWTT